MDLLAAAGALAAGGGKGGGELLVFVRGRDESHAVEVPADGTVGQLYDEVEQMTGERNFRLSLGGQELKDRSLPLADSGLSAQCTLTMTAGEAEMVWVAGVPAGLNGDRSIRPALYTITGATAAKARDSSGTYNVIAAIRPAGSFEVVAERALGDDRVPALRAPALWPAAGDAFRSYRVRLDALPYTSMSSHSGQKLHDGIGVKTVNTGYAYMSEFGCRYRPWDGHVLCCSSTAPGRGALPPVAVGAVVTVSFDRATLQVTFTVQNPDDEPESAAVEFPTARDKDVYPAFQSEKLGWQVTLLGASM